MTKEELESLIGLRTPDAEIRVIQAGFVPEVYHFASWIPAITLSPNAVRIYHDNDKVVKAETQASIDERYANECLNRDRNSGRST